MKILYSKNAVKAFLSISERDTAVILKKIHAISKGEQDFQVQPVPGYTDGRKYFFNSPYYIIYKFTTFKGEPVMYTTEVLNDEDFSYYRQ